MAGSVDFTVAGTSALVVLARSNAPLKVTLAVNDRVHQWLLTRPNITSPKELKGKKIATTGIVAVATFMLKQILTKYGLDGNKDVVYIDPGLGNQLTALMSGVADAAVVGPELRYIGLDKGMKDLFYYGNEVKIPGERLRLPTGSSRSNPRWSPRSSRPLSSRCVVCVRIVRAPSPP